MPSRADGSFLRYHETGVRADQLCAAGRPDPETFTLHFLYSCSASLYSKCALVCKSFSNIAISSSEYPSRSVHL